MKKELFLKFDSGTNVNCMAHAGEGSIEFIEAKDGDTKSNRTFKMNLYNGGAMNVGFHMPVVIDLAGMKVSGKSRPILLNHDTSHPLGHSTRVEVGARSIKVEGEISFDNEDTKNVIGSSKNGFPWQASVGANVMKLVRVDEGETAEANGRKFKGPVLIARQSEMKEGSFVPLGADDTTSVKVAANGTAYFEGMELSMTFKKWLKASGYDEKNLTAGELTVLEAHFNKLVEAKDSSVIEATEEPKKEPEKTVEAEEKPLTSSDVKDILKNGMLEFSKTMQHQNKIDSLTAKHPKIKEEAIKNGWDVDHVKAKVELEEIRAGYPQTNFNVNVGAGSKSAMDENTLKAAVLQAGGISSDEIIKDYGKEAIEAADKNYKGAIGLQELFILAARANGYTGGNSFNRDKQAVFNAAMGRNVQAGFSTLSLPGILSNVANKSFVNNFMFTEQVWREVSAIGRVTDFKTNTKYSLTGDMNFIKLPPGGEIKHATTGEETYTNSADTYARMYSITRTDLINDDLGALTTVPARLGRGAGINFNIAFWTEFLENAFPFYSAGRNNLLTGATSALAIDSLTSAVALFRTQVDPDNNLYGAKPAILLTPPATEVTGRQLKNDTQIALAGDTDLKLTSGNPHAGLYNPITSAYLQDTTITGASDTLWFLLSNPKMSIQSVIETVFLNGQETPTIESADADFNNLGIQMRGFFDWGVNKQEYREGVKSDGA